MFVPFVIPAFLSGVYPTPAQLQPFSPEVGAAWKNPLGVTLREP
jgi:hypothetical protein